MILYSLFFFHLIKICDKMTEEQNRISLQEAGEPLQLKTMLGGIIINTSKVGLLCKIYTLDGVLKYDSVLTKGDQRYLCHLHKHIL